MTQIRPERAAAHGLAPVGFWLDTLAAQMIPDPFLGPGEYLAVGSGPGGGISFCVRSTDETQETPAAIERAVRAWYEDKHKKAVAIEEACTVELAGASRVALGFTTGEGSRRIAHLGAIVATSVGSLLVTCAVRVGSERSRSCAEIAAHPLLGVLIRTFSITSPSPGGGPAIDPSYVPAPERTVLTRAQLSTMEPKGLMDAVSLPPRSPSREIAVFACVEQLRTAQVPFEAVTSCRYALWKAAAGVPSHETISAARLIELDHELADKVREYPVLQCWTAALRTRISTAESVGQVADFLSGAISLASFAEDAFEVLLSRGFMRGEVTS